MTHIRAHRQTFIELQSHLGDVANCLTGTLDTADVSISRLTDRIEAVKDLVFTRMKNAENLLEDCLKNDDKDTNCQTERNNVSDFQQQYNAVISQLQRFESELARYRNVAVRVRSLVDLDIRHCITELHAREVIVEQLQGLGTPAEANSGGSASVYSQQSIGSSSVANAIKPASIYDAVLKNAPDHNLKAKTDFLYQNLDRVFFHEYEKMTSVDAEQLGSIYMPDTRVTYLYDMGNDNDTEFRVIAAYGYSQPATTDRDSSRMRAWLGPTDQYAEAVLSPTVKYDKGHFIAHSLGGGFDMNLFLQKREINRGWSDEGKIFRSMENYAKDNVGTLVFSRPLYDNGSGHPYAIEYGVFKQDGTLWLDRFENR